MEKAHRIIGAEIKTYGHFDCYSIPNEKGHGISNTKDITLEEFLKLIIDYFDNKEKINYDYGDDLKEQNSTKRFIKSRITSDCEELGRQWCNEQEWKKKD